MIRKVTRGRPCRKAIYRQLAEGVVVDVTWLTYLDSAVLAPLLRWARAVSRDGRPATARGANPEFDRMIGVMGMTSVFVRED